MYTFGEKNNIVQSISGSKYFEKDRELYVKHCSNGKLGKALSRATEFTKKDLDGKMVFELLDKLSKEDILANRETENIQSPSTSAIEKVVSAVSHVFVPKSKKKEANKKSFRR